LITKPPVPVAMADKLMAALSCLPKMASGTGGFVINGESAGDKSGISVSSAGCQWQWLIN
jgi:hypothetical protein